MCYVHALEVILLWRNKTKQLETKKLTMANVRVSVFRDGMRAHRQNLLPLVFPNRPKEVYVQKYEISQI